MADETTYPSGLTDEDIARMAENPQSHSVSPNGRSVSERPLTELLEARAKIRAQKRPLARFQAKIL